MVANKNSKILFSYSIYIQDKIHIQSNSFILTDNEAQDNGVNCDCIISL